MKQAVIFDLEGTLTDTSLRVGYVRAGDYKTFNEKFLLDPPKIEVVSMYRSFHFDPDWHVVISTGKSEREMGDIHKWMDWYRIEPSLLLTRLASDNRPSPEVKASHLVTLQDRGYMVALAVDDRKRNIDMYQDHGILTIYIPGSDY
jgi:beta-phosphoglucomutase-like phosphatase (HAD superfamily)